MRINEYIEPELMYRFSDEPQDIFKKSDTRRPRLTLKHLNKLRKMRDLHRIEQLKRDKTVAWVYRIPKDDKNKKKKGD